MTTPRTVSIVRHTHWDREWYEPFQALRLRLVDVLDGVLDELDRDPSAPPFLLDGQMAAVDDYLEVRPGAAERIGRLVTAGRLAIGPWYVLPDEFLVSGETLIRNLELGLARAGDFGPPMEIGYLPDMFGHVAQMPQLLALAGFAHAVVWRGVPSAIDRTAFWWSAPNGSEVRAEYLPRGYGNGAHLPYDPDLLLARARAHEAELGELLAPRAPLLWMNGGDHEPAQAGLGAVVAAANALDGDSPRLALTSLADYLASAPTDDLPSWRGELRSGARANLLPGVASNRVDVKVAAARAERALERRAEPLCALFLPPARWPGRELELAWREVVRNAAHDSVCACSADEVVETVLSRYTQARQIADGLAARALVAAGGSMPHRGWFVVNPSARARSGLVEVMVEGDAAGLGQVIGGRDAATTEITTTGARLPTVLGQLRNRELAVGTDFCAVEAGDGVDLVIRAGPVTETDPAVASQVGMAEVSAAGNPTAPVRIRLEQAAFSRVLVNVEAVPGFGWAPLEPAPAPPVRAWAHGMANHLVTVEVDPVDGTFAIDGHRGLDRLVGGGDAGDTYNYSPPPDDKIVDQPDTVAVEVIEAGPVRAVLRVVRTYDATAVTTDLELRAGERLVRVTASLDNAARDHRLRTVFPLPAQADRSVAECAFAVVERGLEGEGGPHERAMATFPSRRFVHAGGLTVVHEGLLEYELIDGGRALALTLLRCVGLLSGTDLAYRPLPAGPPRPVEGAQMQGRHVLRYAVCIDPPGLRGPNAVPGLRGPNAVVADPYALADDAFLPLEPTWAEGGGGRPAAGSHLTVEGAEVSSVRRVNGRIEVRVFNPTDRYREVSIDGQSGWLVDLRGRRIASFEEYFGLGAWGIATARLG